AVDCIWRKLFAMLVKKSGQFSWREPAMKAGTLAALHPQLILAGQTREHQRRSEWADRCNFKFCWACLLQNGNGRRSGIKRLISKSKQRQTRLAARNEKIVAQSVLAETNL
ncbi:MAG TPA: hypothetical protein VKA67_11265, partial [Verrucomicrobiae bacterium]|nr:hypothetical protein [Verrucomicrobiae bacterium]